jgi:hypothetical protein
MVRVCSKKFFGGGRVWGVGCGPDSYREGDQVKKRTLANLSKLPDDIIDNLKLALKGALQSR